MDLAAPPFGEFCIGTSTADDARALISRTEPDVLRRHTPRGVVRLDVAAPDVGSHSAHIRNRIRRSPSLGFLAASGNPLEWVLCLGRPVSSQAPHNVTPGAGDLRRPNQVTQTTKEQQ